MAESKTCVRCGELKALDAFHKDTRRRDGRTSECKSCFNAKKRARNATLDRAPSSMPKTCTKCGATKPGRDFHRDKRASDGRMSCCKQCFHENRASRAGQTARPQWLDERHVLRALGLKRCGSCDRIKPQPDFWLRSSGDTFDGRRAECKTCGVSDTVARKRENPELNRQRATKYYRANRLKVLQKLRKRIDDDRAAYNAQRREYYKVHPESARNLGMRRRAQKTNNGMYAILPKEMRRLYGSPCFACGAVGPMTADHIIPLSRGGVHSVGNLIPLCRSCNSSKNDKTWMEWRVWRRENGSPRLQIPAGDVGGPDPAQVGEAPTLVNLADGNQPDAAIDGQVNAPHLPATVADRYVPVSA